MTLPKNIEFKTDLNNFSVIISFNTQQNICSSISVYRRTISNSGIIYTSSRLCIGLFTLDEAWEECQRLIDVEEWD
jgi:hypothetical protein